MSNHPFIEKGPGCPVPEKFANKLTFIEALREIKENAAKVMVCFDFYEHARKVNIGARQEKKYIYCLENIGDIRFVADSWDGLYLKSFIWHEGSDGIEIEGNKMAFNAEEILSDKKEWIIGNNFELLSFVTRYFRVMESYREVQKMREERLKDLMNKKDIFNK